MLSTGLSILASCRSALIVLCDAKQLKNSRRSFVFLCKPFKPFINRNVELLLIRKQRTRNCCIALNALIMNANLFAS